MARRRNEPSRRHEVVDPNPVSLPVRFQTPPTLAQQIARHMGAHERFVKAQEGLETEDDAVDLEMEEDEIESPHELVYDKLINREVPRHEYVMMQLQRRKFDEELARKISSDQARAAAIAEAEKRVAAVQRKKAARKKAPPSAEEADEADE